jgi:hypothetical protein
VWPRGQQPSKINSTHIKRAAFFAENLFLSFTRLLDNTTLTTRRMDSTTNSARIEETTPSDSTTMKPQLERDESRSEFIRRNQGQYNMQIDNLDLLQFVYKKSSNTLDHHYLSTIRRLLEYHMHSDLTGPNPYKSLFTFTNCIDPIHDLIAAFTLLAAFGDNHRDSMGNYPIVELGSTHPLEKDQLLDKYKNTIKEFISTHYPNIQILCHTFLCIIECYSVDRTENESYKTIKSFASDLESLFINATLLNDKSWNDDERMKIAVERIAMCKKYK